METLGVIRSFGQNTAIPGDSEEPIYPGGSLHVVGHVDGVQLVRQEPVPQVHALLLPPTQIFDFTTVGKTMALILDDGSQHVAHVCRNKGML